MSKNSSRIMKARTDPKDILKRKAKQLDTSQPHWGNQKVTAAQAIGAMEEYAQSQLPKEGEEVYVKIMCENEEPQSPGIYYTSAGHATYTTGDNWAIKKERIGIIQAYPDWWLKRTTLSLPTEEEIMEEIIGILDYYAEYETSKVLSYNFEWLAKAILTLLKEKR
jgi:hypothetical protein